MKRIGQLMEEIGFQKEASNSVKESFLRHLFEAAQARAADIEETKFVDTKPQQLSFDFAQDSIEKPQSKIG